MTLLHHMVEIWIHYNVIDLEEQIASLERNIAAACEERDELNKELDNLETMRSKCMEKQTNSYSSIVEMKHKLKESKCKTQEKCQQVSAVYLHHVGIVNRH